MDYLKKNLTKFQKKKKYDKKEINKERKKD